MLRIVKIFWVELTCKVEIWIFIQYISRALKSVSRTRVQRGTLNCDEMRSPRRKCHHLKWIPNYMHILSISFFYVFAFGVLVAVWLIISIWIENFLLGVCLCSSTCYSVLHCTFLFVNLFLYFFSFFLSYVDRKSPIELQIVSCVEHI